MPAMSLKAESVRRIDANPTHLFSESQVANEFPDLTATARSDLLKAATTMLGTYLGYSIEHRQIFARYRYWAESMELPVPKPVLPYSSQLISGVQLVDTTSRPDPTIYTTDHFVDLDPPPPRVVFPSELPELSNPGTKVQLPVEIRFQYMPLTARDSRTLVIKNGLLLLMKTMADQRNDPLAPSHKWKEAVATAYRLRV